MSRFSCPLTISAGKRSDSSDDEARRDSGGEVWVPKSRWKSSVGSSSSVSDLLSGWSSPEEVVGLDGGALETIVDRRVLRPLIWVLVCPRNSWRDSLSAAC